jgi:hypothetical protein
MMTLDEAIAHAEWCAENSCGECADDHRQLAEWLKELKQWKTLVEGIDLRPESLMKPFQPNVSDLESENDRLKAENDKLRNELKAIYMCDAYGVKCKDCKNKDLCAYLMREPGIEVE